MKLLFILFALLASYSLVSGATRARSRIIVTSPGEIQLEGATEDNNELLLSPIDPTADRAQLFQDKSGTIALLSDTGGIPFPAAGQFNVNFANVGDVLEDGSFEHPFDKIQEGFDASSAGDLIKIAPGTYAEALTLPHDLYIEGHSIEGILSIDISSGAPDGMLGDVEYHGTSAIIHGGDDEVANGNLLLFVDVVAGTSAAADYSISLLSAVYDLGVQEVDFDLPGQSKISLAGIGQIPPLIKSTLTTIKNFSGSQSFQNLTLDSSVTGISLTAKSGATITGTFKDLNTADQFGLSVAGAFNGVADNLNVLTMSITGTGLTHGGKLTNITVNDANGFGIDGSTSSAFSLEMATGSVDIRNSPSFGGHVSVRRGADIKHSSGVFEMTSTGLITGDKLNSFLQSTPDLGRTVNITGFNTAGGMFSAIIGTIKAGSVIRDSKVLSLAGAGFVLEEGAVFSSLTINETTTAFNAATVDNKATFEDIKYSSTNSNSLGFAVSTGAEFHDGSFRGRTAFTGESAPNIIGRDLLDEWGLSTGTYQYLAATNELVFQMAKQPRRGDGAGSTEGIPTATTFTANMRVVDLVGLSAIKGNLYLFENFEDPDTTPADGTSDTYGFSTPVGVSVWVLRSQDAQLDIDLGVPGGNITSANPPDTAAIGIAASIVISGTTFEGTIAGSEITITSGVMPGSAGAVRGIDFFSAVETSTEGASLCCLAGFPCLNGVTPSACQRVVVTCQACTVENGIYVVAAGCWTRATDMDADLEFHNNAMVTVLGCTSTKFRNQYVITSPDPVTLAGAKVFEKMPPPTFGTAAGFDVQGNDPRIPTTNENSALLGTSGAPGCCNRYVTDADPRLHSAATIGTANGLSICGQAISLGTSSACNTGALTNTDWSTFNSKQSALTFGIADTNSIVINQTCGAAINDYAKFTATGVVGRSFTEVKTDLSLNLVENTAISTFVGSSNITTLGTVTTGVWNGTAITDGNVSDTITVGACGSVNLGALAQTSATDTQVMTWNNGCSIWEPEDSAGGASHATQALTSGATINWDMDSGDVATLTLAQTGATLANPTNIAIGTSWLIVTTSGAARSITTYGGAYEWAGDTQPVISVGAGDVTIIQFVSDGTTMYGSAAFDFQ